MVTMNVAGSATTSDFFEAYNNVNGGAHIHGDAINTVTVAGDLTAQVGILVTIEDTGFDSSRNFAGPSRIDGMRFSHFTLKTSPHLLPLPEFPGLTRWLSKSVFIPM